MLPQGKYISVILIIMTLSAIAFLSSMLLPIETSGQLLQDNMTEDVVTEVKQKDRTDYVPLSGSSQY